jgi:hypothetical protein
MGEQHPIEANIREKGAALNPRVQTYPLTILHKPADRRTALIGQLHADERTRSFAELLIDLETDESARLAVIDELKRVRCS